LTFEIEQENSFQDLLKKHNQLQFEWQSMEKYIRGLNEYQEHVESKYAMLLE
jgi:hypothetical protein